MKDKTEAELLHQMAAYCSTTERCKQEVSKKAAAAGLEQEAIERILSYLEKERFIDESRFCRAFVNDKLRYNKWGRIKISYELKKKNIPSAIIQEAIEGINQEEYESILHSLLVQKKKSVKGKDERTTANRVVAFVLGKGFTAGEAYNGLSKIGITHADERNDPDDWD